MNLFNSVTSVHCFLSLRLSLLMLVSTFFVCFLMFIVSLSFFFQKSSIRSMILECATLS